MSVVCLSILFASRKWIPVLSHSLMLAKVWHCSYPGKSYPLKWGRSPFGERGCCLKHHTSKMKAKLSILWSNSNSSVALRWCGSPVTSSNPCLQASLWQREKRFQLKSFDVKHDHSVSWEAGESKKKKFCPLHSTKKLKLCRSASSLAPAGSLSESQLGCQAWALILSHLHD